MTIKFSSQKQTAKIEYNTAPVLHVLKAFFSTEEKNWINVLLPASISIKMSALNGKNELIFSNQEPLHLQITPYHVQPVFEIDKFFKMVPQPIKLYDSIKKWEVVITVNNVKFKKGESMTIEFMDRDHVLKRVDDWGKRVHELIEQFSLWVSSNNKLQLKPGRSSPMHEGLMKDFDVPVKQLETADILKEGKLVMAIKPFGLWIMGANGRIDLMKATGNIILVDEAEQFQKPKWKVFLSNNRQQGIELNRSVFNEIINQ